MKENHHNVQLQYQGYVNTSFLWQKNPVLGLHQFELHKQKDTQFNEQLPNNMRLGKCVERFVSHELQQQSEIDVLLENKQVQHIKQTIGELDCILHQDKQTIHLEIVYKFYLYDARVGTTEIEHWIGPNRNDTLFKKLTKLKGKQLPLLYSDYTKPILKALELDSGKIKQRVFFKAQLFTPFKAEYEFKLFNEDCLTGFYIHFTEIELFKACKFYIPTKINWLIEVQKQVDWLNYQKFKQQVAIIIKAKTSPLCWIKFPNGSVKKFFVIWWN